VGIGNKKEILIGGIDGSEVFAASKKLREHDKSEQKRIKKIIREVVETYAMAEDENTNPGVVISNKKPSFDCYKKTVRKIVSLDDVRQTLESLRADYIGYKNCRGLIGATAAIAWKPIRDKTYELITYRKKKRWGTKRFVDDESVKKMDKKYKTTFDNYDYINRHNRLTPNSPCPVLYGIRGDNEKDLIEAISVVKSEPVESWIIFETNQATDDHLQRKNINNIQPYESVIVKGIVARNPHTRPGGHVIFTIKDNTGTIDCAAYEPTKQLRKTIRKLHVGDLVEVYGGVRKHPLTVNLEKINVKNLVKIVEKIENPVCPHCGRHMKSRGKNQGYKCRKCGITKTKPVVREKKRELHIGFYEVPVCARRHLSKPLKRINRP